MSKHHEYIQSARPRRKSTDLAKRARKPDAVGDVVVVPVSSCQRRRRDALFDPPNHGSDNVILGIEREWRHTAGCLSYASECVRAVSSLVARVMNTVFISSTIRITWLIRPYAALETASTSRA